MLITIYSWSNNFVTFTSNFYYLVAILVYFQTNFSKLHYFGHVCSLDLVLPLLEMQS